jgi:hypothetical protein
MIVIFQDSFESLLKILFIAGNKIFATPAPKLPQPATIAHAVPAIFSVNIIMAQNSVVIKVAPIIPTKLYITRRWVNDCAKYIIIYEIQPIISKMQ